MWDITQKPGHTCRYIRESDVRSETLNYSLKHETGPEACGVEVWHGLSFVFLCRSAGNAINGDNFLCNNHLCVCLTKRVHTSTALLLLTEGKYQLSNKFRKNGQHAQELKGKQTQTDNTDRNHTSGVHLGYDR
jgi:hypothetical protein